MGLCSEAGYGSLLCRPDMGICSAGWMWVAALQAGLGVLLCRLDMGRCSAGWILVLVRRLKFQFELLAKKISEVR